MVSIIGQLKPSISFETTKLFRLSNNKYIGVINGQGYALRISKSSIEKNRRTELRNMSIKRMHHIVTSNLSRMASDGTYVISVKENGESDTKHHILIASKGYDYNGEARRFTVIAMATGNDALVFKSVSGFCKRLRRKRGRSL